MCAEHPAGDRCAITARGRSWFGSKTCAGRSEPRGATLPCGRCGTCGTDAHARRVGLDDGHRGRVVCRLRADQPDLALAGGQGNTMAFQRMRRPMRSVAGFARTPSRDLSSCADRPMVRPASGRAEADFAGRDCLSTRVRLTGRGRGYNSQFNENTARSRAGYPGIGGQYLRIRTLLVGGADWLARRRRCSPAGVSGAGSATHRGSGMFLEDFGHKGPDAPRGGSVRVDGSREASGNAFVRVDHRAAVRNRGACRRIFSAIDAPGSPSASGSRQA